jgi:hypothetical protein
LVRLLVELDEVVTVGFRKKTFKHI